MKYVLALLTFLLGVSAVGQSDGDKFYLEGKKHLLNKNYSDAISSFETAIEKGGVDEMIKMAYVFKGQAYNGIREYKDAILSLDEAIKIDPNDPKTYLDRGLSFAYASNFDNAIIDFQKVLELDTSGSSAEAAYYWLGRVYGQTFKYDKAILAYDNLLRLVPTDAEGYFLRGTLKSNRFNHKDAIADFDLALKYNPKYMQAYANRGVSKINLIPTKDKLAEGKKCFEEACKDLLKAEAMGDKAVEDMVFLYCQKCKTKKKKK